MANMIDYLNSDGLLYFWSQIKSYLGTKVDKVEGKVLSSNDFTTGEKNKLSGIAAGAEVNVNADWNAVSGDAQILNKPSIPKKTSDLTNDSDFATNSVVNTKLGSKVDKVEGKGLSTNDFTTDEKVKIAGIATGAQVNIIEGIQLNGVTQTPTSKIVNLTVITATQVDNKIATAIGGLTSFSFEIATGTGADNHPNVSNPNASRIYLVAKAGTTDNAYDEWAWINSKWERIGQTDIDLTNYVTFDNLIAISNADIDEILAT